MRDLETDEIVALLTGTNPPIRKGQVWSVDGCHEAVIETDEWRRITKASESCAVYIGQRLSTPSLYHNYKIRFIGLSND